MWQNLMDNTTTEDKDVSILLKSVSLEYIS